jgi:hypothetical protein
MALTPDQARAFNKSETAKWAGIIKKAGIPVIQ